MTLAAEYYPRFIDEEMGSERLRTPYSGIVQPLSDRAGSFCLQSIHIFSRWLSPGPPSIQPSVLTAVSMLTPPACHSSVQSLSHVRLFATPWIAACQASLFITDSRSSLKLMSIESVMPSSHLILCRPLLLLPSTLPSIRVFSSESALCIRWLKYWSLSFNISPSNEHPGLICFSMDWLDLLARVFSNTTVQKHQFFCAQLSL